MSVLDAQLVFDGRTAEELAELVGETRNAAERMLVGMMRYELKRKQQVEEYAATWNDWNYVQVLKKEAEGHGEVARAYVYAILTYRNTPTERAAVNNHPWEEDR